MAYNNYTTKIYAVQYSALKIYNSDKFMNVLFNITKMEIAVSCFIFSWAIFYGNPNFRGLWLYF